MERRKVDSIAGRYSTILLVSVFVSAVSQVLLKKAAMQHYDSVIQEYLNPKVMIGYVLFAVTSFFAVVAYRVIPLSMGPVFESTSYIYVTVFGSMFFGEKINIRKLIALGFMIAGIIVCSVYGMG